MKHINKLICLFSYGDYKQEFLKHKALKNNMRIVILAGFLALEQSFYGLFLRESGTEIQKVHYLSALVMLAYFFLGLYLRPKKDKPVHQVYVLSIVLFGVFVAVFRSVVIESAPYHLSTIYIAVIYGLAVIFYLNPLESFAVYLIGNCAIVYLFTFYHSHFFFSGYIEDSIVNCIIAWTISVVNYKNFLRHFINKKIIEKSNQELSHKNKQIIEMNKYLEEASIKDPLMGIFNRRKLDAVLNSTIDIAREKDLNFSIILMDIDEFKNINDVYGHKTGDHILIEIGKIFSEHIHYPCVVGRWGGEEFMVVCPNIEQAGAQKLSEKLRALICCYQFSIPDPMTASFGVASYKKGDTLEEVIQRADEAMYRAKKTGRNRVEIIG